MTFLKLDWLSAGVLLPARARAEGPDCSRAKIVIEGDLGAAEQKIERKLSGTVLVGFWRVVVMHYTAYSHVQPPS
jgi:hypothetical protein